MPPKCLFGEWPRLARELGERGSACVLLDFDGTLSPFAKKPHLASIPPEAKRAVVTLASDARFRVGVISGRSLQDVKQMVGVPGIFYAGNHGIEVEGPGLRFVHPLAEGSAGEVKECASALTRRLGVFAGAIVEDKGLTASVHYRLVGEVEVAPMLRIIEDEAKRHRGLILRRGKRVVEIRPDIDWGKGRASELILERVGMGCLPIYVGDDETDEEAFGSPMIPWTVRVMDKAVPTKARYCLRDVAEVRLFLEKLASWSASY